MAKIVTLKDNTDDIVYPITPVDGVFVDNNTTLADELNDKADVDLGNITVGTVSGSILTDATVAASKLNITHTTDNNGFTEMSCGTFKIYLKKGSKSITVSANGWKEDTFSSKPTNLDTTHTFFGFLNVKSADNAIATGPYVNDGGSAISTLVNNYGSSITTTAYYRVFIIEFLQ